MSFTTFVELLLMITGAYLFAGVVFYFFFAIKGMTKLDESTQGTSLGFKLIIAPGVIVLWPLLLVKLIKSK